MITLVWAIIALTAVLSLLTGLAAAAEKSLMPGQHSKERLSLMSTVVNKMLVESGFKTVKATATDADFEEARAEGRLKATIALAEAYSSRADSLKVSYLPIFCFK